MGPPSPSVESWQVASLMDRQPVPFPQEHRPQVGQALATISGGGTPAQKYDAVVYRRT